MVNPLIVIEDLKMARESLCRIEHSVRNDIYGMAAEKDLELIQGLIAQIDVLRPLGSDGNHGDLHTANCGCAPESVTNVIPRVGEVWSVTVEDPQFTRVHGTTICAVHFVPSWGSVMFERLSDAQPWLEFNDSEITRKERLA